MKLNLALKFSIVVLVLGINWLTFHDLFEPHTIRDWLILLTSLLVFVYFGRDLILNFWQTRHKDGREY